MIGFLIIVEKHTNNIKIIYVKYVENTILVTQ